MTNNPEFCVLSDQQPKQGGYPVQGGYPQQQYPTHQVTPQQHQQNPTYPHQAYPLSGGYGPPPLGAYPRKLYMKIN